MYFKFLTFFLLTFSILFAQDLVQEQKIDRMVQESGIDPTSNQSSVMYAFLIYDPSAASKRIINRFTLSLATKTWLFTAKYDLTSLYLQQTEEQKSIFSTNSGDLRFAAQNTVFKNNKHTLALSGEILMPLAKSGYAFYGNPYLAFTPLISYSVMPILGTLFVIQSKYTFDVLRELENPALQVWVTRFFAAQFTRAGYFFVLEARPMLDFTSKHCDVIMAPIVGKALGKGFNLIGMLEFPTNTRFWKNTGPTYQLMLSKSFNMK